MIKDKKGVYWTMECINENLEDLCSPALKCSFVGMEMVHDVSLSE